MKQSRHFKYHQSGQGLVEYAILLLLTITLVIGGIELTATALASGKAKDASEAAVNEYVLINQKRINLQTNLQRNIDRFNSATQDLISFLDQLDTLTNSVYENNYNNGTSDYLWANYEDCFKSDDPASQCNSGIDIVETPAEPIELEVLKIDTIDGVGDNNGSISDTELYYAVKNHLQTKINGEYFDVIKEIRDLNEQKAIMLFDHIQLSTLPLDPRINLSQTVPLLGDHDVAFMDKPMCDVNNDFYDSGFYGVDNDLDGDGFPDGIPHLSINGIDYPAIYLFNPLQIDVDSCQDLDANRGNRTRISILVNGYGNEGEQNYVKGMPKLHQAYYSQYQSVCLNNSNQYDRCDTNTKNYLKPPGKLCLSSVANSILDSCPGLDAIDPSYVDTVKDNYITGYYFWGIVNESVPAINGRFQWVTSRTPVFRPTFQLLCNGDSPLSESIVGQRCSDIFNNSNLSQDGLHMLQINVRYRSVFESFLAFGMHELQDASLADYFYDPANLRRLSSDEISGSSVGSELGPKAENRNPTVKPFKDFRGCYEVQVETNSISSCN